MAKIEFKGIDEYAKQLAELGAKSTGVIKYAVYDAAGIVADAIKENTPVDTGDLKNSLALTNFKDEDGFIYTQVTFVGYDRKGVPNLLKARALESGTSKIRKRPFIRPAVNRVKQAAEFSIETQLDKKINEIMNEKG